MSSLEKCLLRSSVRFWIGLFVFLILRCMSCLYILEINPLSVPSLANIFSHSIACLFILFIVSFAVQKLVSLIRSHLFFKLVQPRCSLLQGLTRLQSTCQSELGSHLGLGVLFQVHMVVGRIHFLAAVELLTYYFFKASHRSCFFIHSASLCLLVGAFNPFPFKVIINMYVPIIIFLIVLGLFSWVFFLPFPFCSLLF